MPFCLCQSHHCPQSLVSLPYIMAPLTVPPTPPHLTSTHSLSTYSISLYPVPRLARGWDNEERSSEMLCHCLELCWWADAGRDSEDSDIPADGDRYQILVFWPRPRWPAEPQPSYVIVSRLSLVSPLPSRQQSWSWNVASVKHSQIPAVVCPGFCAQHFGFVLSWGNP